MIIKIMEEKHFFIGGQDIKVLTHLASKNSQKDLVAGMLAQDAKTRQQQINAMK